MVLVDEEKFTIVNIPHGSPNLEPVGIEPVGKKSKLWFQEVGKGRSYLFKVGRPQTGDDWSEKVACELCELLVIPHAHYELAEYDGERGVISPSFVPEGGILVHGNEILSTVVEGYPRNQSFKVYEHKLDLVMDLLAIQDSIKAPYKASLFDGIETSTDFFVGYLMMDAWIANQDRHHENWGLLAKPQEGLTHPVYTLHLAPSYDHASCLGSNELDIKRAERLRTRDAGRSMERYARRAKSAFYSSPPGTKPMATLEVFRQAAKKRPQAARAWLERLKQVSPSKVQSIFERIPNERITSHGIEFATKLLEINQHRLLEGLG